MHTSPRWPVALFLFLLLSASAQAQHRPVYGTLKPRLLFEGRDTLFVFNLVQMREIAKRIAAGEYDSREVAVSGNLVAKLETKVLNLTGIIELKAIKERELEGKIADRNRYIQSLENLGAEQDREIKSLRRRVRLGKWGIGLGIGVGLVGIGAALF